MRETDDITGDWAMKGRHVAGQRPQCVNEGNLTSISKLIRFTFRYITIYKPQQYRVHI